MTTPCAATMSQESVDTTWWCEYAWLGGDLVEAGVTIAVSDGYIVSLVTNQRPPSGAYTLPGLTIPGAGNAHSHAFHRALRSHAQRERGSFWTWRDTMYRVADRLDPDSYYALARGVYTEMVLAGITSVGEFRYLQRLARRERGVIDADRLLRAATADGQQALGWQDAGALRVGMRADLVAVDIRSIRTAGGGATAQNVVFAASAADVTDVVVDGRTVVSNRLHVTIPDPAAELDRSITALLD